MNASLTWRLWRRLRDAPEESPIYRRALRHPGPAMPWYTGCAEFAGFLLLVPMFTFTGPVYGLVWAVGVSTSIAERHATGVYELAALAPPGPLAISWALGVAGIHRDNGFVNVNSRNTWVGRAIIVGLLYFAFVLAPQASADGELITPLIGLAALAIFMVVDHVQSIVLGSLVGMLTPTYASDRTSVQLWAFSGFLGLQLGSYLATLTLVPALVAVCDIAGLNGILATALTIFGCLAFFTLARELLVRTLWRMLLARLNADEAELDLIRDEGL